MSSDDHKGIANLLALPLNTPVRTPKVETQEDPIVTLSESLMRMEPLSLPKDVTKEDHKYNDKNPRHRREVLEWMTRPEPKINETPQETWNRLAKHGVDHSQKKIGNAPPGSKQQKIDIVKHIEKMKDIYDGPTVSDQEILNKNVKYVGNRSDNPSWMKDLEKTGPYGKNKNKRFVNNTLNKFENRTTNSDVVTFDPTTQLFTDETRNIAFKTYDQAKRWNDAVNREDTKEMRKNDSKANPNRRLI